MSIGGLLFNGAMLGASGGFPTFFFREKLTINTDAGQFTSGSPVKRALNFSEINTTSGVSINTGTSVMTFAAGTYEIIAWAPALSCFKHKLWLQNTTAGAALIEGESAFALNAAVGTLATAIGRFTVAASITAELQHQCSVTAPTNGLGQSAGFGSAEFYSGIRGWKVA